MGDMSYVYIPYLLRLTSLVLCKSLLENTSKNKSSQKHKCEKETIRRRTLSALAKKILIYNLNQIEIIF